MGRIGNLEAVRDVVAEAAGMIREEDEELVRTGIAQSGVRHFFTNKNEERFTFQNNNLYIP